MANSAARHARPRPAARLFARGCLALSLWVGLALHALSGGMPPVVLITNLPAYGTSAILKGCVLGANPATQAMALFIYVPGYGWVTKPACAQPLSTIHVDGSWSASIVTGGSDQNATRIAALLVGTNYNQSCVDGAAAISSDIYAQAVAKAVLTRPSPGVRFFSFSGYDWWVKNETALAGPGPNYFSDATNNVWTDTNGWLHLRITHRTNQWQCAEIISARTFGPGNYRFELNSPVDAIDTNVTLGLFTWSDDPAFTDREIDVECGRWNNPADTNNAQFVVQPFDAANHLVRYRVAPGLTNTTHLFVWQTNVVNFQAQTGGYSAAASNLIYSWVFTNATAVPVSGDEAVHLNLWLFQGHPPANGNEVEVIVKNFSFVPLGTPPDVSLTNAQLIAGNRFQFSFNVQPDFHYALESSTNLTQWQSKATTLATNGSTTLTDTNAGGNAQLYRVETLP